MKNKYPPVRNLFKSFGNRFNNISPILRFAVDPFHSVDSRINPFAGLITVTITEDNRNVVINIKAKVNNVFGINLLFNLIELNTETLMLVNTTGTAIYFNIVIYSCPIEDILGANCGHIRPNIIPLISPTKVNTLNLFFI